MRFNGEKLRELRKTRRLDQTTLAGLARVHASGITQAQISRYENGQQPSGHNALALAAALEIEVRELYSEATDDEEDAASMPLNRDEYELYGRLSARIYAFQAARGTTGRSL